MSSDRRAPRHTLSRDRVVAGAMAIADHDGLPALTIRSLATHLDVKPMAIYHYVATKDALLDALVEQVFTEIERPVPGEDWRAELARRSRSARAVLLRHPWSIGLLESRTAATRPATLDHHEAVLATLRAAGFSAARSGSAYLLLDSFVYGFALQEATMPATDAVPTGHPVVAEVLGAHVAAPGFGYDAEFETGLTVVLDGIAGWR
ncbi:TetR/AcrR family transcriptional regulator [Pimelobacter simplex]|uniref:TetR/AcrR family transcriptional regulator n=1 Tax=Nocardioides simplex TaxID=2045 RepID=UPI003AAE4654